TATCSRSSTSRGAERTSTDRTFAIHMTHTGVDRQGSLARQCRGGTIAVVGGRLVQAGDTRLFVLERGDGPLPLFVLHGGPGCDHTMFGHHLDGLGAVCRLLFVDLRSQGRSDP